MTGLEKIIGQIKAEADAAAASAVQEALAQAGQILEEAKSKAQAECAKISRDSAVAVEDRLSRARSAAELQKRKMVLGEKQRLIGQVIDKARNSLDALPEAEYFNVILKMAEKFSLPQKGEILFSKKDLERLPQGFEAALNKAVGKKGAVLAVSRETRKIDGGFVLVYGGVEENCSISALFESAGEALQDKAQQLLFS